GWDGSGRRGCLCMAQIQNCRLIRLDRHTLLPHAGAAGLGDECVRARRQVIELVAATDPEIAAAPSDVAVGNVVSGQRNRDQDATVSRIDVLIRELAADASGRRRRWW